MSSNATEVMNNILEAGKARADDSPKTIGELAPGDFTAQGDVVFWRLGDKLPKCKKIERPDSQLAPGTTKGSRHCIRQEDMGKCEFYSLSSPNAIQGPMISSKEGFTVEHPEHGDQTFPPGNYLVTYQRVHAEELRRVAD